MSTAETGAKRAASGPARRLALVVVAAIGLGLVAVPFAFGMFAKAPKGAVMIAGFRPFRTTARLDGYQRELAEIDGGVRQTETSVAAYLDARSTEPGSFDAAHPGLGVSPGNGRPSTRR